MLVTGVWNNYQMRTGLNVRLCVFDNVYNSLRLQYGTGTKLGSILLDFMAHTLRVVTFEARATANSLG